MESAAVAVTITAAVSTVDNVGKVMDGEITPQEAFIDVAKDTGIAGGVAYASAVEFGAEHVDELADKAQEMANKTVEIAKGVVPDQVGNIAASLNDFAAANNLPFHI